MSVRVMTLVWETDLPAREKLVLLALADCANDEGRCWPGRATLIAKTGQCMRTLQEALRVLDSTGHISREEIPGKGMIYDVHPVAKSAPVANAAPVAKSAATGGKKCHGGVAKSAPKPSKNRKEPSPPKIARELPGAWKPQELALGTRARAAMDEWPPGEREAQLEQFEAHHRKNGSKFKEWQQAWITWVLNTRKFGIGRNYERSDRDPTTLAVERFLGSLGADAGTGEMPQTCRPGNDDSGRPARVAASGG